MQAQSVDRRSFIQRLGLFATAASVTGITGCNLIQKSKPNILFIAVDDLRPELGCYGHQKVQSPNIDKLASEGTRFTNAFCNVPVCGASRASLLTGIRPTRNKFVSYYTRIDDDAPGVTTLPTHFKSHGYHSLSLGKIAHHRGDILDHWSQKPWRPDYPDDVNIQLNWRDYISEENIQLGKERSDGSGWPYEAIDIDDSEYYDGKIADRAIEEMQQLSQEDKPFFMAVGFLKPHLPFTAPKKYWDLYNADEINLPDNYYRPENAPDAAMHNFGELRAYHGIPKEGPVSDEMAKKLIHGYMACVSYTDAQIGRVLNALEKSGQAENTIVILWGDHGWNLGEHALWCKHCNFKTALHVPMIVKAPGTNRNQQSDALTEFVDIFPTLCDLAHIPTPNQCEGSSFAPLLKKPNLAWKEAIFSQWHEGATIKTKHYAYTEWQHNNGEPYAQMLYDHRLDPNENVNIAELPENQALVTEMKQKLALGWRVFTP